MKSHLVRNAGASPAMRVIAMRRLFASLVVVSLSAPAPTLFAAPAPAAQSTASLAGQAMGRTGQPLANVTVQLRSLTDGKLAATITTDGEGKFTFTSIPAGNYTVEVTNAAGAIIGTSAAITVAAGAAVTGVAVSSALAGAASGGSFFGSTLGIITLAGAGAAVAAVTVAANTGTASSSR